MATLKIHPFGNTCPACGVETTSQRRACNGDICSEHKALDFYHNLRICHICNVQWFETGKAVDHNSAMTQLRKSRKAKETSPKESEPSPVENVSLLERIKLFFSPNVKKLLRNETERCAVIAESLGHIDVAAAMRKGR